MKRLLRPLALILGLAAAGFALLAPAPTRHSMRRNADDPYRPDAHFSPPNGWMNDPNGMVYFAGEYHLFYQHHPEDIVWGPMHWGHAVSTDLVHWMDLPIALYPDDVGYIFSGSAVIDWQNTAGFGDAAMVALFTHEKDHRQMQSVAYSTDRGRTWTKYAGNPVIEPPNNIRNFRDPKVVWYDQQGAGHWVMMLAAGNTILFYTSPDLKTWTVAGGFGPAIGATCGVWETPDLFELPVDGGSERRWVLSVAVGDCAPAGGSGVQYFVGDFDGYTFTNENDKDTMLWVDYGADFYAPQRWNEAPGGRSVWAAWMNNWRYANEIPATSFRGSLTLPRELALIRTQEGVRLVQHPIPELARLRGKGWRWDNLKVDGAAAALPGVSGRALEIIAEFAVPPGLAADRFGLRVRVGAGEGTTIGYGVKQKLLYVDRTHSGQVGFHAAFPGIHVAPMAPVDGKIRLHIFVDRTSIEVLGNDGRVALTDLIFPQDGSVGVEVFSDGGPVTLTQLDLYQI